MSAWLAHATIVQERQRFLAHVCYDFRAGNTDACGAFFELWFYRRAHRNRWFGVWPIDWNRFVIELLDSFVEKVHTEMLVAPERCWQCKLLVASRCHFCEILAACTLGAVGAFRLAGSASSRASGNAVARAAGGFLGSDGISSLLT